jgi:hypothetical protein
MKKNLLTIIFTILIATLLNAAGILSGTNSSSPSDSPGSQPSVYTVTAFPNQANGGYTTGGGAYTPGSQVSLDAKANEGWVFINWTEYGSQVSSDPTCDITVDADRNLTANFVKQFSVSISSSPARGGYTSGENTYPSGEMATLKAYPNNGWAFSKWTENRRTVSTSETYTTYVDANRNLVANFVSAVGLQFYQVPSFKIYPNPTDGLLIIENDNHGQSMISEISLINSGGECVYRKNESFSDRMAIDISNSKPGAYNLRITLVDGKFTNYKIMLTE